MKSGFRIAVSLALCLLLLSPASPASACCEDDDFWCWARAVVTGGLSCAIENLINSINDLIRDVQTLVNTISADIEKVKLASVGGVQSAGDDLKNLAKQAKDEYADARKRAENAKNAEDHPATQAGLAGGAAGGASAGSAASLGGAAASAKAGSGAPPTGGSGGGKSAPMLPASADAKALKDAMQRGAQKLGDGQGSVDQTSGEAASHAENARKQAINAADVTGKIVIGALLTPLTDLASMLLDLIKHPDRLFNPAALVDDQVKRVTATIDSELTNLADAIAREAKDSLDASSQNTKDTGDSSNAAKAIADQMEKLHKSRTKADLDKLNALLPPPNLTIVQHFAGPALISGLAPRRDLANKALLKTGAGKNTSAAVASALDSKLKTSWSGLQKKQQAVLHPVPVPGADAKFKQKFEAMFKGLTKTQADAKKNELLAEARRRFGNDAKILSQTQNLINLQAQKSLPGGLLPAISR